MEDSFRVRVDKVFGSLLETNAPSSSSSSPLPYSSTSLWSLSDEEIEKKQWTRGTNSPDPLTQPYPSYTNGCFAGSNRAAPPDHHRGFAEQFRSDLEELDDDQEDDDDNTGKMKNKINDESQQVWEIRSSIGLDCTLDYEEEEDEYDKVATGRENARDRIYMRDMVDYGIDVNAHNELPSSFKQATRDPRANHMAARLRLREDAEAAGDLHSLNLSDILDRGFPPKPILKKREYSVDEKSSKRVRFHEQSLAARDASDMASGSVEETSCLGEAMISPRDQSLTLGEAAEEASVLTQKSSSNEEAPGLPDGEASLPEMQTRVPDYLRNPTRYTRYTLDSSNDMDEASNRKAYLDFLDLLEKKPSSTKSQVDEASLSFQRPLTFTPRKKPDRASLVKEDECNPSQYEDSKGKAFSVSIASGDTQEGEDSAMDEVGFETVLDKSAQKPGRRYRTRTNVDSDDVT